jgi:hypothetical protein
MVIPFSRFTQRWGRNVWAVEEVAEPTVQSIWALIFSKSIALLRMFIKADFEKM